MAAEVSMTRAISASGERNPNLLRRPPRSWTRHPYGVPQDPSGEALPIGAHQSRADHSRRELNPNPLAKSAKHSKLDRNPTTDVTRQQRSPRQSRPGGPMGTRRSA
jgi:hypothetical protein